MDSFKIDNKLEKAAKTENHEVYNHLEFHQPNLFLIGKTILV